MYCESHAACGAYSIADVETGKEVKYLHRYFVDDATGISGVPANSEKYERINTGMQAAAVGGSFLSITNNSKKTAILSTQGRLFPKNLTLIHLSGARLTCDKLGVKNGTQRDLGWGMNMTNTRMEGVRHADQHIANRKVIANCKRASTISDCTTEVLKVGYKQKILGTLQNSMRVEQPTHSSVVEACDIPMADGVLTKLECVVDDTARATPIIGLSREHGGLGFSLASDLAAKTAGIEVMAAMEGRNDNLKRALKLGLSTESKELNVSGRIRSWLSLIGVDVHGGEDPSPAPTGGG